MSAFIAQSYLLVTPFVCLFLFHYGLEFQAMPLRQDFVEPKTDVLIIIKL